MSTHSQSRSNEAQSETSADEKRRERGENSAASATNKSGAQGNSPQTSRVRGSGFTEGDANKSAAPQAKKSGAGMETAKGPAAAVGQPAASGSHARGSDADDQLANGKRAPRGTNTNGGKSNEPR